MSERDDIERAILDGDPYDRAVALEDRVFPLSIEEKLVVCILALASSSLLAPLLYYRRNYIEQLEETRTLGETLSPTLSTLTLLGILTTFAFGLILVSLLVSIQSRTLSIEDARRLVRIEDLLLFFAASGVLAILSALLFASIGAVSTAATERLYETGVRFYSSSGPISVDSRPVSALGLLFAATLYGLLHRYRRTG